MSPFPGLGSSNSHKEPHKGEGWLPGGKINGERRGGKRGDPRAGNAWSVGLGSKMGAVLTATEASGELGGRGSRGGMGGTHMLEGKGLHSASWRKRAEVPTC